MPVMASGFPMSAREINGLSPLDEHKEYKGDDQELEKTIKATKDRINRSLREFSDGDNEGTEDTIEDDYGFFPMDDDDDFRNGESQDRCGPVEEDTASTSNSENSSDQLASSSPTERRRPRKKSALKRGSAYGDNDEGIPLDFERKEFNRVLPTPDLSQRSSAETSNPSKIIRSGSRGLFRVASEPVFVRPVYQSDDDDELLTEEEEPVNSVRSCGFVEGVMKKRISFGTIQIREHVQTMGDNPSCTYGTPVELGWEHYDMEQIDVDEYEAFRPRQPRTKGEFHLNHFQRTNLLKLNGHSVNEIKETRRKVTKMRNQRERTKFLAVNYPMLWQLEDAIESGVRKVKRSVSKSKLNAKDKVEIIPRKTSKDDMTLPIVSGASKALLLESMNKDESNATAPF